jgi:ketosteroid isomerase-like protein
MSTAAKHSSAAALARDTIGPWTRACVERDWDALLEMCADDVLFMPPGADPVRGASVRPWLETFPAIKSMSWSPSWIEEDGDIAWFHGPVEQTLDIDGREVRFVGKYACIMRRDERRGWLRAVVIWNSNET